MTPYILHQKRKPRTNELTDELQTADFNTRRVLDHDHFVVEDVKNFVKFHGPVHSNCNLKYKIDPQTWKLPIMLHNLKNYDLNLIIKALEKEHGDIRVVPNNIEKFLSMTIGHLRFIDPFQIWRILFVVELV